MKKMKKGFTIVELVIVIGVIAILSAVLIPTFVNLSSKAKEATAKQEVADTYTAYVVDKNDKGLSPNAQTDVCIKRGSEYFTYTVADGWKAGEAKYVSGTGADANPDTYNGIVVYEKTDTHVA